jgi:hypothetical protein
MFNSTGSLAAGLALLASVLAFPLSAAVGLHHVHGLAYSPDGSTLLVPSHYGLAVYRDGRWSKTNGPPHDYMGFTVARDRFYSSGHPAPGSNLVNPFGLMRSRDLGKTWEPLGLSGEADFHLLAAGYESGMVYAVNGRPNSRMSGTGLYWTLDAGMTWTRAEASGLRGRILSLAPHPRNRDVIAVGTDEGLYLSRNRGGHFASLAAGTAVTASSFALDGRYVWFGRFGDRPGLARADLASGAVETITPPPMTADAISYITQNPVDRSQWAAATYERDVYVSADRGRTWRQIARRGTTS